MELVSVIIAAYNCRDTILSAIHSALSQTYQNIEVIVCDDSSTDDTWSIIKKIKDPRVICTTNIYSKGAAGARNSALKIANGSYVAFLDSDDYWTPSKIEKQISFMEKENLSFSYSNYYIVKKENISGVFLSPSSITYNEMLKCCNIACSTVIIDKRKHCDVTFPYIAKEDYALWLRLLSSGANALNTNYIDSYYRVHDKSVSANKLKEFKRQDNVLKFIGIKNPKRIFYLFYYAVNGLIKHHLYYKRKKNA